MCKFQSGLAGLDSRVSRQTALEVYGFFSKPDTFFFAGFTGVAIALAKPGAGIQES